MSANLETLTVPQVLLFMRAGPLYPLSRDQRRETLHRRVPEENVELLLNESYLPIEDWAQFSDADIQELQIALFKVGRNLGLESVWKNHDSLYDDLGTDHDLPLETRSEQMSRWIAFDMDPFYGTLAIDSFILNRMKRYEKKSFSLWHLANTLFFFFTIVDALPKVGQFCSLKSRPFGGPIVSYFRVYGLPGCRCPDFLCGNYPRSKYELPHGGQADQSSPRQWFDPRTLPPISQTANLR